MTIQTVLSNIIYDAYYNDPAHSSEKLQIETALGLLYSGSKTARDMLDQVTPTQKLNINFSLGKFEVPDIRTFTLNIDIAYFNSLSFITPNGKAVTFPLSVGIAHELVHAIIGLEDTPLTQPNFAGNTVTRTNIIHDELGLPHRLSYLGGGQSPDVIAGMEYTNGAEIDTAIYIKPLHDAFNITDYEVYKNNHIIGSRDLLIGDSAANKLSGSAGNDFLYGNGGNDNLFGDEDNDLLSGGNGDDILNGGSGNDILDGGADLDTVKYDTGLFGLFGQNITISERTSVPTTPIGATSIEIDLIVNVEKIQATNNSDNIDVVLIKNTAVQEIHAGDGSDTVSVVGSAVFANPTIYLEDGNDILNSATRGSIVYGGAGSDTFQIGQDYLIADADTTDVIMYGTQVLHGGVTWEGQESPWAKGMGGIRYGKNSDGELVIKDPYGRETFVANFNGGITGERTAGIMIGEMSLHSYRLFDAPGGAHIYETFEAIFGYYLKAMTGKSYFAGVDPLVLDLDGDGLELNARTSIAPYYDVDADGFAEQTGWVRGDDAFLVRDLNANGKIDDVKEMFGNGTTTGFTALKVLDSNNDGKISSLDTAFASLKIWRDLDSDAITDAGELQTLTQANIKEISLANSAANQNIAGNIVTSTASFTKTDGTTGTIGDVTLRANQRDTVWLGDKTIDAVSATLPELKGYGTLTDLRIAMTDSATLKSAVQTALPKLSALNLTTMRNVLTPVFNAWRAAVPVPAGTAGTKAHVDVPILTQTTITGTQVNDFAYQVTDSGGTYWKLASGTDVKNSTGGIIARPTITDVMAQTSTQGTWTKFAGAQIQFLERYLGTELPIGVDNLSGAAAISAAQGLLHEMWDTLNDVALRLAVQGPLAAYFAGVKYNPLTNHFEATTDQQLAPSMQAIFNAAPKTTAGATTYLATWKPILDVFLQSFDRGADGLKVYYAFLFKNIIAAYENVGLAATLTQAADAFGIPTDLIRTGVGTVVGGDDADLFYLGAGDQIAQGGLGPDTYIIGKNFGHDVIDDVEAPLSGSPDSLRFAHLNSTQVTMVRDGLDLIIKVNGATDDLRIIGQFEGQRSGFGFSGLDPDHGVQEIIFANGEVWDRMNIAKAVSTHTDGDDIIVGTDTIDFLDGGKGNDTLTGAGEGDIYLFGMGDGQDKIYDNIGYVGVDSPDTIQFKAGLTLDMVTFTRDGHSNDLVIKVNGTSDQLTITDQFAGAYTWVLGTLWLTRIEGFVFDDGTTVSWDQVFDMVIQSGETSGNDIIYGFSRTDVIDAGAGDDYLSGGEEGDLYIMGLGYGHDTIQDGRASVFSGDNDTLQFLAGVDPSQITMSRPAGTDDLILSLNDGSSVTIKNQFYLIDVFGGFDTDRIEYFTFADAPEWNFEYVKQHLLDINSTSGDDIIYGYSLTNDVINGGDGNDYINGLSGVNIITGGKGNDTLIGDGDDTYIYNQGDGVDTIKDGPFAGGNDTLKLTGVALKSTNVILTRSADLNSATLSFGGVADSIILDSEFTAYGAGLEYIIFSDGVTWTKDDLQLKYLDDVSTDGNDIIYGFGTNINHSVNDTITGGKGDDYMNGSMGDDIYIHAQGDGFDTIEDGPFGGNETLKLTGAALTSANAIFTRSDDLNSVTLSFKGVTDKIFLKDEFGPYGKGIETIVFSDGATLVMEDIQARSLLNAATIGNDTIYGFYYRTDTVTGGKGDDYMNGLGGDDIYIHTQGDGFDTIEDEPFGGNETLKLTGTALTLANAIFTRSTDLNSLTLSFKGVTDQIFLKDEFGNYGKGVETIIFSDGATLVMEDIQARVLLNSSTAGNDTIYGFYYRNDTITGGKGDDFMNGLGGDDIFIHNQGDGVDTIREDTFSGDDTLKLTGAALTSTNVIITHSADFSSVILSFSGVADKIIMTGEWTLWPGVNHVIFSDGIVWNSNEFIFGTAWDSINNDIVTGNGDNNILLGFAGNDTMAGGDGNDTLIGGLGADIIDGGIGIDTVSYSASTAAVTVNLALTTAQSGGEAVGDILSNIENIIGSSYNDTLSGNSGNNVITGGAGNDTLIGKFGADTLDGGAGIDTASYSTSTTAVTVNLSLATAHSGGDATGDILSNIENVIGSAFNDNLIALATGSTLTGGAGNDIITGDNGNDTLIGGVGADVINGNAGIDTASYSGSTVGVNVNLSLTTAQSGGDAIGDILSGIENLIGSAFNDNLIALITGSTLDGGAGNDILTGGIGSDVLIGGLGADTINGGAGIDIASYAASTVGVNVNLNLTTAQSGGDAAGDLLSNIENVIGSAFNDTLTALAVGSTLTGGAGIDVLNGGAGVDILIGGTGADTLNGGAGIDTVSYASSTVGVNVNLTLATAQSGGDAAGDILSNIENVIGSAFNDNLIALATGSTLTGGAGNDIITGGIGSDILIGGLGADTINGGAGIDTVSYTTSTAGITVNLNLTTAQIGGDAAGDLLSNIENITGSAFNDVLTGNIIANIINGGDGNDSIYSRDGNDTVSGGNGDDTIDAGVGNDTAHGDVGNDTIYGFDGDDILYGDAGNDIIWGEAGNNTLIGGAGIDTLYGFSGISTASYSTSAAAVTVNLSTNVNTGGDAAGDLLYGINSIIGSAFADNLTGGTGNDTLMGGAGKDTLAGGAGADIFKYTATTDSGAAAGVRDIIVDFTNGTDKVDLSSFTGDFVFKGTGAFTGTAHEVNYAQVGGNTILGIDADGNGSLDFQIELTGLHTMTASDFLL